MGLGTLIGQGVGSYFGGPIGGVIGGAIGSTFDPNITNQLATTYGPRLSDLHAMGSAYGESIPILYGTARIGGNVIWALDIREEITTTTTSSSSGGKGGGGTTTTTQDAVTYAYFATFAVAICEGPINGFGRIWANNKVIYENGVLDPSIAGGAQIEEHLGTEDQLTSTIISGWEGVDYTAHRGIAYIVLYNIPLEQFGNTFPQISAEVSTSSTTSSVFSAPTAQRNTSGRLLTRPWKSLGNRYFDDVSGKLILLGGFVDSSSIYKSTDAGASFSEAITIPKRDMGNGRFMNWQVPTLPPMRSGRNLYYLVKYVEEAYDSSTLFANQSIISPPPFKTAIIVFNMDSNAISYIDTNLPNNIFIYEALIDEASKIMYLATGNNTGTYKIYKNINFADYSALQPYSYVITEGKKVTSLVSEFGAIFNINGAPVVHEWANPTIPLYTHVNLPNAGVLIKAVGIGGGAYLAATNNSEVYKVVNGGQFPIVAGSIATAAYCHMQSSENSVSIALGRKPIVYDKISQTAAVYTSLHFNFSREEIVVKTAAYANIIGADVYYKDTIYWTAIGRSLPIYGNEGNIVGWGADIFVSGEENLCGIETATDTYIVNWKFFNRFTYIYSSAGVEVGNFKATNTSARPSGYFQEGGRHYIIFSAGEIWSTLDFSIFAKEAVAVPGTNSGAVNITKIASGILVNIGNIVMESSGGVLTLRASQPSIVFQTTPIGNFRGASEFGGKVWFIHSDRYICSANLDYTNVVETFIDYKVYDIKISEAGEFYLLALNAVGGSYILKTDETLTTFEIISQYASNEINEATYTENTYLRLAASSAIEMYGTAMIPETEGIAGKEMIPVLASDIISDVSTRCGLIPADISISDTSKTYGYVINGKSDGRAALEPILGSFFIDAVESDTIKFLGRESNQIITVIPESDIVLTSEGDLMSSERIQEAELPISTRVNYLDLGTNFQLNTAESSRINTSSKLQHTYDLALVMSSTTAQQISEKKLYTTWYGRNIRKLTISSKYSMLEPSDLINVTEKTNNYTLRIISLRKGADLTIELICIDDDLTTYNSTTAGDATAEIPYQGIDTIENSTMEFIDIISLTDSDDDFFHYVSQRGETDKWKGGTISRSIDGQSYTAISTSIANKTVGRILNDFSATTTHSWDNLNKILVKGFFTLETSTDANILSGTNAIIIGNELIQYVSAVFIELDSLTNEKTYEISRLLRGRRGSESVAHISGERVVTISGNDFTRVASSIANVGSERIYKTTSTGQNLSGVAEELHTYNANNLKPLSPVHPKVLKGNDIIISWVRRNRIWQEWIDGIGTFIDEPAEAYVIDIFDANDILLNTYNSSTPTFTYTAAQQANDAGFSYVKIIQLSSRVGRGSPLPISIL